MKGPNSAKKRNSSGKKQNATGRISTAKNKISKKSSGEITPVKRRLVPVKTIQEKKAEGIKPFPVVGIGSSAGGLEAFTKLLQHLPANLGMAYVYIQHLSPNH